MARSQFEIDEQIGRASEALDNGSKYPGMSYEDGVMEAINWMRGDSNDAPMPDE